MPPPLAAVRRRRISSDRNDAAAHEQTHSPPSVSFSANLPSNEGAERNVQKKKKKCMETANVSSHVCVLSWKNTRLEKLQCI